MTHANSLWPTEPDDTNSRPNWRDIVEDIVAADLNAFEALIRAIQDRLGDNTYGGGASEFFAYQHPSGGLRLRVNPGNFYGGASDPTWIAQQDSGTLTGPVTNPRIDVLVLDNAAGTVSWVAGSEGASPAVPAVSLDKTPLWAVYLRVGATTIDRFGYNTGTNSYVYRDMRPGKYRPVPPFRLPGEISPTSFSATQNDYNPTGLAAATTLRLTSTGASRDITGIAGGSLDRVLVLHNIGSQNIVLKDANTGSSAANRFAFPSGDVTLLPNGMALLAYDSTSQRWRTTAAAAGGGGGGSGYAEIDEDGSALTARTKLNFVYGLVATDDSGNSRTNVNASLTTASALLGADVTITTGGTFYDGPSVSLAAGTWLVVGSVCVGGAIQASSGAKLWDGTTVYASGGGLAPASTRGTNIPLGAIITLGSTTTIKISASYNDNGAKIQAALGIFGSGNNASWIAAVKVA